MSINQLNALFRGLFFSFLPSQKLIMQELYTFKNGFGISRSPSPSQLNENFSY